MFGKRSAVVFDSVLILAYTALLIWPLFQLDYLNNWSSIESTFIADARLLGHHLPHPGWQPLWYCGTRFDYIYPPALRYGTALLSLAAGVSTAHAYHLYTGFWYLFGILAVYWLVRNGSGSRKGGLLAAMATSLLSPSFVFLPLIRRDSGFWIPQRLHVLMAYGEGPHISALCILTAALAVSFNALRRWNAGTFAVAGALCALAVANNFYGATALALFFPAVVWAVWLGESRWTVWLRACGIAALAWGLCAFWLSPSYLRITLLNLKWVSQPGNKWSVWVALGFAALFCALSWRAARKRPDREWTVFVVGAASSLSLIVLGLAWFGLRVAGDSYRLVPELDLALILLFVEGARHTWQYPRWRIAVALTCFVALLPAARYLRHAWTPFVPAVAQRSYEYKIGRWVDSHLRGERVLAAGSARFWFDAWFDNVQTDGGSDQGIENQILPIATWQILKGDQPGLATLWLQALGTDAIVAGGRNSLDAYRDYPYPEKFSGAIPALYDDGHDTVIYRIPRLYPGVGRVVETASLRAVGPIRGGDDVETLGRYVRAIEDPRQAPATVTWRNFDEADIQTTTSTGQALLFQETYDPGWRAFENGRELRVARESVMGFMLIDLRPGSHTLSLRFEDANLAGRMVSILSVILVVGLLIRGRIMART